ncbi:MAG: ATP synthase F1 subunit gamma [Tannerella sp.]|jgi:F-type H+-transporting ATPase subunit gamma|nr:ATP synthase F1 subunit gamma [Tannerella sp.]
MASFKSIKARILSIRSTRKITSAMKMVSSAKLHKAQDLTANMLLYSDSLYRVMAHLLSEDFATGLSEQRAVNRIALVLFSSDTALCGTFNANIAGKLEKTLESCKGKEVHIYTVGKKIYDAVRKQGITVSRNFENLASKPDYKTASDLAATLMQQFISHKIDRAELIYHHFKSAGSQLLMHENLLPVTLPVKEENTSAIAVDYIYEPSREELLQTLIPESIKLKLYTALLDSNASEHAARMISMQTATENADRLINELTLLYNKSRQQAITSELLDIISGSMRP